MAEKIEFDLDVKNNGLSKALDQAQRQTGLLQKGLDNAVGFFTANIALKGLSSLQSALSGSVTEARSFSKSIAEINSILPKNAKLTDETTQSFIELSKSYGSDAQTQAKAFYNIVSAGVQGTKNQLETLKTANEAATAGLVDINTSATVLVSSVNAYAAAGLTAKQASDSLFQTVKDGQTTFGELARSLGQVAPLASSAGVSFNDLNGTIAFLTASGIKTPQAITGIRAALTAIIKPTSEAADAARALGLEFSTQAIAKAGGFPEFLNKVKIATGGSTQAISKLFGSVEATNAILAVTGGSFEKFTSIIDNNRNSLGATADAAEEVKKSLDFQLGQLESEGKALSLTIGNLLVPALKNFASGLKVISSLTKENTDEYSVQRERLSELAKDYNNLTDAINSQKKSISFVESGGLQASEESLARLNALEEARNKVLKERQSLRSFISSPSGSSEQNQEVVQAQDTSDKIVQISIARNEAINKIRGQALIDAQDANQQLLNNEIVNDFARQEAELQRLIEFDTRKKELEFQLAEEKASSIQDETEKRIELERIAQDRIASFQKIADDNEIKANKLKNDKLRSNFLDFKKFEDQTNKERVQNTQDTLSQIATLSSSGNKTLAAIGKAAAISNATIDGYAAVQKTLASLPFPANIAAASLVGVATAANVAKIAGVQFENGGPVGGFNGASVGGDNRQATIRDGEVVLNAVQQKNLMDMLNNGGQNGDIIVQIDGREIFRAVRNQLNQGMKLA